MTTDPSTPPISPLTGLRALDLTRLLPGPYAAQILTELGAETLKVEEIAGGDGGRTLAPLADGVGIGFLASNRGKRSAALNLKDADGREALLRLVERADILLEGFRPGVMARLGLGYDTLLARNPRLVICALTGYGQNGPYEQRAGHDLNYLGYAGLLGHLARPGAPPPLPGPLFADIVGGALMSVIGVLAALVARGVTGRGQVVDVAMLDGSMAMAPTLITPLLLGLPEAIPGAHPLTGWLPGYNIYEASDGRYVTLAALEPKFWAEFCERVGRPDLTAHHIPRDAADHDTTVGELVALFRTRTRAEWLELLANTDSCFGPVNTLAEALADPQVQARGIIASEPPSDEHSETEPLQPMLRSVPLLSATPARLLGRAPHLGEHTAEALAEVGYTPTEIAALAERRAIFTGDKA